MDTIFAKKLGGAFIGGIANNGELCGAVSGALMLIGLKYGQYKDNDIESKEKTIKKINEYLQKFKNEYGSIICRDLLKYDISIKEEALKAKESGIFKTLCPVLVKGSVEIVEKILEME